MINKRILNLLVVVSLGTIFIGCNNNESKKIDSFKIVEQTNKSKVRLVEFIDPECPVCAPFHQELKRHIDDSKVDIEYKYMEIHKNSKLLIHILEASKKQGKFKETLDYMYNNQKEFTDFKTQDNIKIWNFISKNNIDLDISKLKIDIKDIDINLILQRDFDDAKNLRVEGTPTLFINGVIQNNKPIKEIMDNLDLEIVKLVKE